MQEFGKKLIAARKLRHMTQDQLGRALNVSRQSVSHWETGRSLPDAEMVMRLSKLLEYNFEQDCPNAEIPPSAPLPEEESAGYVFRSRRFWLILAGALLILAALTAGILRAARPETEPLCPLMIFPVHASVSPEMNPAANPDEPSLIYRFSIQNVSGDLSFTIDRAALQLLYPDGAAPFLAEYNAAFVASALRTDSFSPGNGSLWMGSEPASRRFSGVTLTLHCTDSLGNSHTVSAHVAFTYPAE